jgi:Tol biopolymer transport system component
MNADGSGKKQLTFDTSGEWTPVWSPDGEKIAYMSTKSGNYEIRVMNRDGSEDKTLTTGTYWKGQLSWSTGGNKIAFVSYQSGNYDIWVMNADGTGAQKLTANEFWQVNPTWSPDGEKIVYSSDQSGMYEIWVIGVESVQQAIVDTVATPVPAVVAAPSPSANTIKEEELTPDRDVQSLRDYLERGIEITLLLATISLILLLSRLSIMEFHGIQAPRKTF